jgi:hypothetical protein
LVKAGENLQAALDGDLPVQLEAGVTFNGNYIIRKPTALNGNGASLVGNGAPALRIMPGVNNVLVENVIGFSNYNGAVFQLGNNDTAQTSVDSVPKVITMRNCSVPTHRGKRGFEVCAEADLIDCFVYDTYASTLQDSQGIFITNTTGNIRIIRGEYQAGSENILVGGDYMKIPGVTPTNILVDSTKLTKPLSWRTDGVSRVIKNLFELKTGHQVTLRDVVMDGCWKNGQDGYAVVITPRLDGTITGVTMERVKMVNVSAGFNITGLNNVTVTPIMTTGLRILDCELVTDHVTLGGRGCFMQVGGPMGTIDVERLKATTTGTSFVLHYDGKVERLRVADSDFNVGIYSFMIAGGANASLWANGVTDFTVTGNTIRGSKAALKTNLTTIGKTPENVYIV